VIVDGPHAARPVQRAGVSLERARAAMILLHGRGAGAADMLGLASELAFAEFAYLAPEAMGRTWYPYSFLAPIEWNEPWLSSALALVGELVAGVESARIPAGRIVLLGFSQGACLALEVAARHARRYGGVVGLSGGLIGPDGTPRDYPGTFDGTPVLLGCSDVDPHVPVERVHETADVFRRMGASVSERIYPGMGHTVNADEIRIVREILAATLEETG
jgi:predicted esterase